MEDIIHGEMPIRQNVLKPSNKHVASKPPLNDAATRQNTINFLALPIEIRLQIYDILLLSRFPRATNHWPIANPHNPRSQNIRMAEPKILQTCKQIYNEANPILYTNIIRIGRSKEMFRRIVRPGLVNLKLLRRVEIYVPCQAKLSSRPWLRLLGTLAEEASGLRYIGVVWNASYSYPLGSQQLSKKYRGLGDNLNFVRALGRIQGLEELEISGYNAKHWPAYLERTGARVRAVKGYCVDESGLKEQDISEGELDIELRTQKRNECELLRFEEYQQGTEGLIP